MNSLFAQFRRLFPVDWVSLLVGWRGIGQYHRLIALQDVTSVATDRLAASPTADSDLAELAMVTENESDVVDRLLSKLAMRENGDADAARRKWVVCLLKDILEKLPEDPLYGLLGLTEFWSDLGFPADGPHIVQGRGNKVDPKAYYTAENFEHSLNRNRQWLEREITALGGTPP